MPGEGNVDRRGLPYPRPVAAGLTEQPPRPENAPSTPANVMHWNDLVYVFKLIMDTFGRVDVVVANAGIMESFPVLDVELDDHGDPVETVEISRVLNINLKGTINLLKLSLHYIGKNPLPPSGWRGSIVCVTSTSGYFGATGNAAYIASKHGVVGLVRAASGRAAAARIKLSSVAPCYRPTNITAGLGDLVEKAGLESNKVEDVAVAIACLAADEDSHGVACLVWGKFKRELELSRKDTMDDWLGIDLIDSMGALGRLLQSIGGYPLPPNTANL